MTATDGTWNDRTELDQLLGPELAGSFKEFLDAQTADFKMRYPNDRDWEEFDGWISERWGYVLNKDDGSVEVTVYERTSQYCGSFRWDSRCWDEPLGPPDLPILGPEDGSIDEMMAYDAELKEEFRVGPPQRIGGCPCTACKGGR